MISVAKSGLLIFKIFFKDANTLKKLFWVILSFSLSLAFVLCNLGLMQGYEEVFRNGLRETQGDLTLISREGFFHLDDEQASILNRQSEISKIMPLVQTEVFMIFNEHSKAVQMRTVTKEFEKIISSGELVLGEALAQEWGIKVGDTISLMFARGNTMGEGLPEVKSFKVKGLKKHRIYLRDARTIYASSQDLAHITNAGSLYNVLLIDLKPPSNTTMIEAVAKSLQAEFGPRYTIRPFWYEFSGLLEAVQVEKNMITIALQLIILVAMFNMISFFRVLFETHYQAIFLLRALGLSLSNLKIFLLILSLFLWLIANVGAWIWSVFFSWLLKHWSVLSLPGKIYQLAQLDLSIGNVELGTVAFLSLIWILILWWWFIRRMGRADLVSVLKGEWR